MPKYLYAMMLCYDCPFLWACPMVTPKPATLQLSCVYSYFVDAYTATSLMRSYVYAYILNTYRSSYENIKRSNNIENS